jgi:hypothetical protein
MIRYWLVVEVSSPSELERDGNAHPDRVVIKDNAMIRNDKIEHDLMFEAICRIFMPPYSVNRMRSCYKFYVIFLGVSFRRAMLNIMG